MSGSEGCGAHSTAEELRLLAQLLVERSEPLVARLREGTRPFAKDGPFAQDGPEPCTWCPLCAVVGLVRGDRPELAARLAEHATGLLAVLRDAAAQPDPAPHRTPSEPGPRVQRVTVRRGGEAGGPGC